MKTIKFITLWKCILMSVTMCCCRQTATKNSDIIIVGGSTKLPKQSEDSHYVESVIAVNPTDQSNWAIASMMLTETQNGLDFSCQLWVSRDKGENWIINNFPDLPADPQLLFRENGDLIFLALSRSGFDYYVSNDKGQTWSQKQSVNGSYDHPFLYEYSGKVTCVASAKGNRSIYVDYDLEDGSNGFYLDFLNQYQQDNIQHVVLKDGRMLLPFLQYQITDNGPLGDALYLVEVKDSSDSFYPVKINDKCSVGKGFANFTMDKDQRYMYLISTDGRRKFEFNEIGLNVTADIGQTWSYRKIPNISTNRFYCPAIAINKKNQIGIFWYGKNETDEAKGGNVYFSFSDDYGITFSDPVLVNTTTQNDLKNSDVLSRFPGGGHYSGIEALADNSFQIVWSDSNSGVYQLYTSNIKITSK